jgi:hypothetical protein
MADVQPAFDFVRVASGRTWPKMRPLAKRIIKLASIDMNPSILNSALKKLAQLL